MCDTRPSGRQEANVIAWTAPRIGVGGASAAAPGALRYKGGAHKQLPTYDVAWRARGLAGRFRLAN